MLNINSILNLIAKTRTNRCTMIDGYLNWWFYFARHFVGVAAAAAAAANEYNYMVLMRDGNCLIAKLQGCHNILFRI